MLIAAITSVLLGCGPGVGGTGTGGAAISFSGEGTFATGSAGSPTNPGKLELVTGGDTTTLSLRCGAVLFRSQAPLTQPDAALGGELITAAGPVAAVMRLHFNSDTASGTSTVTITIVDAAGAVLLSATLQQHEVQTAGC